MSLTNGDTSPTMIDNGSTAIESGDSNNVPPDHIELFIRAGKDGESCGGCPLCQRLFMILMKKANAKELTFTVTTVNIAKPPMDFKKLSGRVPTIVHGGEISSDPDEMIQYIDQRFPYPPMIYDNKMAAKACMDVFSKFSFYIKDVSRSPESLLAELHKLDDYLQSSPHMFLCRDEEDHLDCLMLPKLQHIRVASAAYKNFEIPESMKGLWSYLATAYSSYIFCKTCPSDQEIMHHWQSKPELPMLPKDKRKFYSTEGTPRYSHDVPKGVQPRQPYTNGTE